MSNYKLFAQHLGPILSMQKGELSEKGRNLIFARNGTGKSFLSRAFRYLDLYGQRVEINKDAPLFLVSEESSAGTGVFEFTHGGVSLGKLELQNSTDENNREVTAFISNDIIFHVFSDDFIQEELRDRGFEIDGDIENKITVAMVGQGNVKLHDKKTELEKAQGEKDALKNNIEKEFDEEKNTKLVDKAEIHRSLKEYSELNLNDVETLFEEQLLFPGPSLRTIIEQLEKLKSIPADIDKPKDVELVEFNIDIADIETLLKKPTSPSSVADDIKARISRDQEFYEKGLKIIDSDGSDTCPFCEQGITSVAPRAIIDAYMEYFSDAESKHKNKLKEFDEALKRLRSSIDNSKNLTFKQKSEFDKLKAYIPPQKDIEIEINEELITDVLDTIEEIKNIIGQKIKNLSSEYTISNIELSEKIQNINTIIETNDKKVNTLNSAVQDTTDVRKGLQRDACKKFKTEFVIRYWGDVEKLRAFSRRINAIQAELTKLENAMPSEDAKDRVAKTLKEMLQYFFQEKYTVDEFVIKREKNDMKRGPDRTLSDGEKTIIAFCYFIASIHRKVESNNDYKKLFLVFDDPVTSVSYDFIFSIVETLKNLKISDSGEISIFPRNDDLRPKFLILTHNSYFYSISITQKVVEEKAGFSFEIDGGEHIFTKLEKYAFPFKHQLKHIYEIAEGRQKPKFYTANSIRSVLEEIGRFCRPDKAKTTKGFIDFLSSDMGISINIYLLNCLSHGLPTEEVALTEEIRKACEETIRVVGELAPGQIIVLESYPSA